MAVFFLLFVVFLARRYLYQAILDPILILATALLAGFNYYAIILSKAQPALAQGIPLNPDFTFTTFHLKLALFLVSALVLLVTVGHDVFEVGAVDLCCKLNLIVRSSTSMHAMVVDIWGVMSVMLIYLLPILLYGCLFIINRLSVSAPYSF